MSSRYTPVVPSPLLPITCNCACQRCLDGDCCLISAGNPSGYTFTTTSVAMGVLVCGAIDHDFAPFNEGTIFCRKCGTFRLMAPP